MHKGNSRPLHRGDGRVGIAFAVKEDFSAVGRDDAGEDVHQRGFSRAVLTQERMNLSQFYRKVHVRQRLYAAKRL